MKQVYSDLQLEKYLLKELDQKMAEEITDAYQKDDELKKRLDTLKKSNDEFFQSHTIRQEVYSVKLKLNENDFSAMSFIKKCLDYTKSPILSGAVALCLMFIVATPFLTEGVQNEGIRLKGLSPHLIIYKKTNDQVQQLKDGSKAAPGELLQLSYVAAGEKYGAVFSIDGNGLLTLHYPELPTEMAKLVSGKQVILSNAYELDNSPNFETFYFITSDTPIKITAIIEHLKAKAKDKKRVIAIEQQNIKTQYNLSLTKIQDL